MTTPLALSRASLGALDFGAVEPGGVAWVLNKLDGWGSPAPTLQVTQKPRSSGGWAGPSYLPARNLALSGTVDAPTTLQLSDAADRLSDACSLDDTTLTVIEAGRTRYCTVRRAGEVLVTPLEGSDRAASWSIQLVALDPRKLAAPQTASTGLPVTSGGLTVPFTVPFAINSTVVTGQINLANPGTIGGKVQMIINGPVVNPVVNHSSPLGQQSLAFNLTLGAGEFLLIDPDPRSRSVLAQGQASRAQYIASRGWHQFDPGSNTWAFTATGPAPSASLVVTATPAWP